MARTARSRFNSAPGAGTYSPPDAVWSGPRRATRQAEVRLAGAQLEADDSAAARLHLQRRAPANLRFHVRQAATRFSVLFAADMLAYLVMRELVHVIRDRFLLGSGIAAYVESAVPRGILNGWQFAAAVFIGLFILGNYGQGDQRRDVRRLFAACGLAVGLTLWQALWMRGFGQVVVEYSGTLLLLWLGLVTERVVVNRITAFVRPPEKTALDTLFVGPAPDCNSAATGAAFTGRTDFRPIGFVDAQLPPAPGALGHVSDISLILASSNAQVVVLCGFLADRQFETIVDSALAARCHVLAVPRAAEIPGVHPTTVWRNGQPLMQLTPANLKGLQFITKRAVDLVGAAFGLVCLSPLLAVLALLIKLGSRGPVFFTQERVGRGGRTFRIFKLRTMVADAEEKRDQLLSRSVYQDPRLFKIRSDPRITPLGRWLRRTSLDELPQLINVLLGQMSLVGPRPPLRSEVALYEAHHYARFDVKPGITGPWQAGGRNDITDFERVIELESEYIRNWSLALDLVILLRTIPAVFLMRGAH